MALPSSGPLSISEIRNEEVNNGGFASTYSLRQLSANAGKSSPDSISEFYGYSAAPGAVYLYFNASGIPNDGTSFNIYYMDPNGNYTSLGTLSYGSNVSTTLNPSLITPPNFSGYVVVQYAVGAVNWAFSNTNGNYLWIQPPFSGQNYPLYDFQTQCFDITGNYIVNSGPSPF